MLFQKQLIVTPYLVQVKVKAEGPDPRPDTMGQTPVFHVILPCSVKMIFLTKQYSGLKMISRSSSPNLLGVL